MPRPIRIEYEGAWYHVMNRGASHQWIFSHASHYELFLSLLKDVTAQFSAQCHAYCLMGNHYHLLIHTPKGNLSKIMQHIDSMYTQKFNLTTKKDGPLFRGRYKSILVDVDHYLIWVSRYIHLNPVAAGIVKQADRYRWSSYRYYLNPIDKPSWLFLDQVLEQMNYKDPVSKYKSFVEQQQDDIDLLKFYEEFKTGNILGSTQFKNRCLRMSRARCNNISDSINFSRLP